MKIGAKCIGLITFGWLFTAMTFLGVQNALAKQSGQLCEPSESSIWSAVSTFWSSPRVKPCEITWVGNQLSDAQFSNLINFSHEAKRPLERGDVIQVLTREEASLLESEDNIETNEADDQKLVLKSDVDADPHELLRIRLHLENGNVVDPGIEVIGTAGEVNFDRAASQLFVLLHGSVVGITEIEIVHTHPYYPVRVISRGASRIRPIELSRGDLQAAMIFAARIPAGKYVKMTAISPIGLKSTRRFATGRQF